ncbi:hypothetical protein MO867_15230 [Microbulbifer sp. OS29]|uniref:Spore coat protein U (SCPU) domain-containing protein n=1 Tax=Microbulbifer okhotskensis TaxID=2926617 RepID=A0A9X2EUA8_9GAMM|nr:hypothetical protein [Microbulbifer okhotskensis]MCO1335688.1 hypothetical protein [Microbulbifer okhotskensis]
MQKTVVRSLFAAVTAGALLTASAVSMAASDSASSDITLSFTPTIEITRVDNLGIANPTLGTDAIGSEDFCVGGLGFSTYSITFASNDGENDTEFSLTDDGTNHVPYSVGFDNSLSGTFNTVTAGDALQDQSRNASSCGSSDNARFQVTVANSDWENATILNGTSYSDTLLITVASE